MAGDFADIPYVQAAHFGGPREKTKIIVMHATDNTASDEGEVAFEAHRPDSVSAHFTNDEDSIYQSVPLDAVAFGCLWHGNHMSVQFEQCGKSGHITDKTMRGAAAAVRRVADRYGIPLRKIGPVEVRAAWYSNGSGGICGHADVTRAFPEDKGDHLDPGWDDATWSAFIGYVHGQSQEADMPLDALQAAQVNNAERYSAALFSLADKAIGISDTQTSRDMPSPFGAAFKQLVADVADLKARPPATVDAAALATALVAHPDFITALAGAVAVRTVDEEARRLGDG